MPAVPPDDDDEGSPASRDATQRRPVHGSAATVRVVGPPSESATEPERPGAREPADGTPTPLPPPPSTNRPPSSVRRPLGGWAAAELIERRDDGTRYSVSETIGVGGMGEVVAAVDRQIGREVAIKRIRSATPSRDEVGRFLREARIQGRLEHPAIVPVHDLLYDETGKPFFVMKKLAGTDMHTVLQQIRSGEADGPSTRRALLRAFVDVCNAIELAHQHGIVHRDLKPANIMLGDFGEVYVLDWGVARAITEDDTPTAPAANDLRLSHGETQQGTVLGTPAYMAPEQLVGDRAGPPADIYALGCILYEIAAGEPLYNKMRTFAHAFKVVDPKPSSKRPDSPPELDTICERAIRIDPATRFESARAIGAAVQAYLDGDRDVAVRRELAQHHLVAANAALRASSGPDRQRAIQAAGRALALDPTAGAAADLVTRLMLEPPEVIPDEVERHLAEIDTETARQQGRVAAISVLGYLAFLPLLLWSGVTDPVLLIAFAALSLISGAQVLQLTRNRDHITPGPIYLNATINALLIGVVCRMVGPFIIAPTLVITTLMGYASHPRFGKLWVLAAILSSAVVVPWLLEIVGVLDPTYQFIDGKLVLSSSAVKFSSLPTQLAFALLLLSLVGVVAALSRALAIRQRDAARQLEIQAWHLRQIVPTVGRTISKPPDER